MSPLPPSAAKVQSWLASHGYPHQVQVIPDSAHTAEMAAGVVGCQVAQIAKSLIFQTASGQLILMIVSGENRVDESVVESQIRESISKAPAKIAEKHTGFTIGGIPPVGYDHPLSAYFDRDLLTFPIIWVSGGHHTTFFPVTPQELIAMTGSHIIRTH